MPELDARLPLLEARELSFAWPAGRQLRELGLRVYPGDLVLLRGAPGAGKSTLLKLLCGRLQPASGQVLYRQKQLDRVRKSDRLVFGFLDQQLSLPGERKPRDLIELVLAAKGLKSSERRREAMRLLAETGQLAQADKACNTLSIGQQRWVQLALALCGKPDLLLLDEPFHHLGEEMMQELLGWLRQMPRRGSAVVLSSHRPLDELQATRELLLEDGQLHERSNMRGQGHDLVA